MLKWVTWSLVVIILLAAVLSSFIKGPLQAWIFIGSFTLAFLVVVVGSLLDRKI